MCCFFAETALDTGGARLVPPRLTCVQHSRRVRDPSTADRGGEAVERIREGKSEKKERERKRKMVNVAACVIE
jgi:hypothetical protein